MKRIIIRLVIGFATFFIGIALTNMTADRLVTRSTPVREFKPATPKVTDPPPQVAITTPTANVVFDYDPNEFNPRGDYFIIGRKPKGFPEFDALELAVDHERATGRIMIQTYENQTYDAHYAISGLVTDKQLTFVVAPRVQDGLQYSFSGYFLRGGIMSDAGKNRAVLKGRLVKSKDGVRLAEAEVKFRIEYLGC